MRVTEHPEGRFLGFVQVKVASRIYTLPVQALPMGGQAGGRKAGFLAGGDDLTGIAPAPEGTGHAMAILVDSDASDGEQRETIARASAEAAKHISRKVLN